MQNEARPGREDSGRRSTKVVLNQAFDRVDFSPLSSVVA